MKTATLIDAVLEYVKCDWHIFPIKSGAKTPLTPHGFKDSTADEKQLAAWWKQWPNANIGIACGKSGLLVLDIDPRNGGDGNLSQLFKRHGKFPETVVCETGGGGLHYYFQLPTGKLRNLLRKGIDIKHDGGYVIAPPSNHESGGTYRWRNGYDPETVEVADMPDWLRKMVVISVKPTAEANKIVADREHDDDLFQNMTRYIEGAQPATEGERNKAAFRLAGHLAAFTNSNGRGAPFEEILKGVRAWNRNNSPPLSDDEVQLVVLSAMNNGTPRAEKPPGGGNAQRNPSTRSGKRGIRHLTDIGNGERFTVQHGENVRYSYQWSKWLVWDGRRWAIDQDGEVERLAKRTARSIYSEASDSSLSDTRVKAIVAWAKSSERTERLKAMITMARSEKPIPIAVDSLDSHPWLLNCENATIDLRTGELHKHRQTDYLTKMAPVEYPDEPGVDADQWSDFQARIFENDQELTNFVQRLIGMTLVGEVREHVLPIFYGKGANGKSVFLETISGMLGEDYAMKAPSSMLMASRSDRHPTELADLHGKRLVSVVETEDGRRLAESLVKELTGGDSIRARRMRENFWQFRPSHSVIMCTNHKPIVRGNDNAIWRRLRLVPFTVTIPEAEQDTELTAKLKAEWPAILRWAVEGCLAWQREGLETPDAVTDATGEYKADQDVLGGFLAEACLVGLAYKVKASSLYASYRAWADTAGEYIENQRTFGRHMTERGFQRGTNNGVWYQGVALREDREP
jgi:putative DNA primase/helicase